MEPEPAIWWTLPGPRGFVVRLVENLEVGRNCIVRLPVNLSLETLRGSVRKELAGRESLLWEHRTAQELVQRSLEPPDAIADIFGITRPSGIPLSPYDVVVAPTASGFMLWLDGWDEVEPAHRRKWIDFVRKYAHAAKQPGRVPRSAFCLAFSGVTAIDAVVVDDVLLADQPWWSVVSRLDMAVLVDALTQDYGFSDDLLEAMIVRASGFDPRLAAWLLSRACRDGAAIGTALRDYAERVGMTLTNEEMALSRSPTPIAARSAAGKMPPSLAGPWSRGLVNHVKKEGLHWHLGALAAKGHGGALRRELWGAQASVMLPRIDQQRIFICRYLNARYGDGWMRWHAGNQAPGEGDIIQVGHLKFLFDNDDRLHREPEELRRLVRWLHFARNELSHLRDLSAEEMELGKRTIERAATILCSTQEV